VYGYERPTTPGLERLARESTTFDFAMSTAPWTLKSHGTLFTGLYPGEIEGGFERALEFTTPVLAEEFGKRGYMTTGIVANLLYTSRESGLAQGFVHYDDYHLSARQLFMHSWIAHTPLVRNLAKSRSGRDVWKAIRQPALDFDLKDFNSRTYGLRSASTITTAFLDWQAAQPKRPFFAFLNYFDAHWSYQSPRDFQRRFVLPDRAFKGLYDAAIAYVDSEVDRLLTELRARGLLDNTIVVITSDHGEQFGDHALTQHANSLYKQLLHVPLLIRYPAAVPAGVRVTSAVTLRDLPATLAQLAGLAGVPFPGTSLAGSWIAGATTPEGSIPLAELSGVIRPTPGSPAAFGPMRAVFDQQFHYIRRGDGVEELFDYRVDPSETSDLSQTAAGGQRIARLRQRLESASRQHLPQ
jgi:arylsulfatase A-like enzyme